jgi:hypothetical protein
MAYFQDLSEQRFIYNDGSPAFPEGSPFLYVGWLARDHPFPTGETTEAFRKKLASLCQHPINLYKGFHQCEFCKCEASQGNGEIHVSGRNGTYVAPTLVYHYVAAHAYQPPSEFIEAVLVDANRGADSRPILEEVRNLADARFREEHPAAEIEHDDEPDGDDS